MTLHNGLLSEVKKIFSADWETRSGNVVPEPSDIKLDNEAVEFERATVLYADLNGSTSLVDAYKWWFAAEIYRTYLYCAAQLIRHKGGAITAYDGDRVMGVFIGTSQTTSAAKCALHINYAVETIINPALARQYPATDYSVSHSIGIDTSEVHVARIGVRGENDLVWVGRAANYAAKLTAYDPDKVTWITESAYRRLNDELVHYGPNRDAIWELSYWKAMDDVAIYGSNWWWSF